jgi:hypothetical protein
MPSVVAFAVVLVVAAAWALLPFVPAIRELLRPTDATPLGMVGRDAGDITFFAHGFRQFVARQRALAPVHAPGHAPEDAVGSLEDGSPFARVTSADAWARLPRGASQEVTALVVVDAPLSLPNDAVFATELYARVPARGGLGAMYRAVLADDVFHLATRSTVLRWIHAHGALYVGGHSRLHNRASSDERITLSRDVAFDRLGAPVIEVVCGEARPTPPPAVAANLERRAAALSAARRDEHPPAPTRRVDGDFEVAEDTVSDGDVIARGDVIVRRGATLRGSVKSHGDAVIEAGAVVTGAVVSRHDVRLGSGSYAGGPLIAEGDCVIGRWAQVGDVESPTSVTCRRLTLSPGARVHGRVAPREGGIACPTGPKEELPEAPA